MCKSKADGGRRCSYHLKKDVEGGLISYASAVTGLKRDAVVNAYQSLRHEVAERPVPTRREVDDFLSSAALRARHDPTLTPGRKKSIVKRILAAIGQVLPDAATFHAWKNVLAESWARSRRRAAAVFIVTTMAFGMGGCATGIEAPTASSHATTPVATSTATPGPSATSPAPSAGVTTGTVHFAEPTIEKAAIDKSASSRWTKAELSAAVEFVNEFYTTQYNEPTRLAKKWQDWTPTDLKPVEEYMTPAARDWWEQDMSNLPDEEAVSNLRAIVTGAPDYVYLGDKTKNGATSFALRTDVPQPGIEATGVTMKFVEGEHSDLLEIKAKVTVVIRGVATFAQNNNVPENGRITVTRNTTLWLAQNDRKWLIDGWFANDHQGVSEADTK